MNQNIVEKKWGKEIILAREEEYACKLLVIDPGKISSLHCHLQKVETFVVVDGEVWFQHRDLIYHFFEGDKIRVIPGEFHRFWSEDGATLLEVSSKDDPEDNERRTLSGDISRAKENVCREVDPFGKEINYSGDVYSALVDIKVFEDRIGGPPMNITFQE